ncbi:hypothetical protein [Amycolatopsis sp. WGS_07]|uniref:hypothetical protein n=1 Tax=Amycolatopsis sp. WGS_07 TaxID=3076764 RepID=UPI003872D668
MSNSEPERWTARERDVVARKLTLENLADVLTWVAARGGEVTWSGVDAGGYAALSMHTKDGETNAAVGDYVVFDPTQPGPPVDRWRILSAQQMTYEFEQ